MAQVGGGIGVSKSHAAPIPTIVFRPPGACAS